MLKCCQFHKRVLSLASSSEPDLHFEFKFMVQ